MNTEFFVNNRSSLYNKLPSNSALILFSGSAPKKIGDEYYPFAPDRNFYYLTGIDRADIVFFAYKTDDKTEEMLFIQRFDEIKAKWSGAAVLPDEAQSAGSIDDIKYIDVLYEEISNVLFNKNIQNMYIDLENRSFSPASPALKFADKIKTNYPYISICNLYFIMAGLRMIKQPCEVDNIRRAIEITKKGIYSMMKNAAPDMYEYEIEAYFDFELKRAGVRDFAFKSIAAAGKNAAVLHYSDNNSITRNNDLILCDVGAQWNYYSADITRTFPVNGRFTRRQRQIYDIVLECHDIVIDNIRPNIPFASLNEILKKYYIKQLKNIGLIHNDEELQKYYYHSVSHMLGLETHDAGRHNEGSLAEGMVFTVEPGLYIAEEGIGIRTEDDVIVTKSGCDVLSADIIRTAEDIEAFMRNT